MSQVSLSIQTVLWHSAAASADNQHQVSFEAQIRSSNQKSTRKRGPGIDGMGTWLRVGVSKVTCADHEAVLIIAQQQREKLLATSVP